MRAAYVFLRDRFYHPAMALVAATVYGFPSRRLTVVGVTGTKGKSTTVELIAHILTAAGNEPAVSSSARNEASGTTMPRCFVIQRLLRQAVSRGSPYAVIEVTSQGVLQSRHRFIRWAIAVFTNLAPEHVEAHGSFEKYRAAKVAFFRYAATNPRAVFIVNGDDANASYFIRAAAGRETVIFGREAPLPALHGDFNGYNAAAALAVVSALGISRDDALRAIASFPGVRGRMELIQAEPFQVIVDYAVTPDSLRAAYGWAESESGRGRIIGVFGCTGGGRDAWKRPVMGGIAGEMCDQVILTDDDSYDEPVHDIMAAIERGLLATKDGAWKEGANYRKIADRGEAIRTALSLACPRDIVMITGKGGDRWLRMAHGRKIPWSDQDVVRGILASPQQDR